MIRPATEADLPVLETLQRFLSEPAPELLHPTAGALILVSTVGAVDSDGDTAVGYLLWLPGDPVYAAELVVAPAYRRQGRGRALFTAMLSSQPPGTRVRLQVAESNTAAQALYESLGFSVIGRDPEAYEAEAGRWLETVVS